MGRRQRAHAAICWQSVRESPHHNVQGRLLGITEPVLPVLAREAIALSGGCDAAVAANAQRIVAELAREEERFASTLEAGEDLLLMMSH